MKIYFWTVHITTGLLAIWLVHDFPPLGFLFGMFSAVAFLGLAAIHIAEYRAKS